MIDEIKLRWLRIAHGYTQGELAAELKVSPSCIGMYEVGQRTPSKENLQKLATLFGTTPAALLKENSSRFELSEMFDLMMVQLPPHISLTYRGKVLSKEQLERLRKEVFRICKTL